VTTQRSRLTPTVHGAEADVAFQGGDGVTDLPHRSDAATMHGDDAGHAIAVTVAYAGAGFAGFARQPGQRTVQGCLENALSIIVRREVDIAVAGRTDAGVHALGQVVSFQATGDEPDDPALLRSLNALAGEGIAVRGLRRARSGFSARFDAVSREYRYRIATGAVPPLFLGDVAWWTRALDVGAMREGAGHLIGEHDFRSFCVTDSAVGKRTFRRLDAVDVFEEEQLGERHIVVRVVGNAFLHSMVRVIVGTLVEVGAGRRDPEWVAHALSACQRSAAGPTAPALGLTLWKVEYPDEVWLL
jgi:tRNA pseudouridine38-40 synthase